MRVIAPLMPLCLAGCKTSSSVPEFPGLDESRFERSVDMRQPKIEQRPVLYVSEGREATFSDGNKITREQKSVTENGVIETTGRAKFSDGLHLDVTLHRVSEKSYMPDVDLSISVFDSADKNLIPGRRRSALKTPGPASRQGCATIFL